MTRAEAIFYIRELERLYASMDKKVAEAVDMAIEALRVDLVRCWECKYCYYADNRVPNEQGHVCDYYHFETEPNGYCHVGIRRKEKR